MSESPSITGEKIWLDGKFVDWSAASIHILTHTLHYGLGVFEGIRCYRTADKRSAVFRLSDHVRRLFDSARINLIEIPFNQKEIEEVTLETLRRNHLDEGYIRPIAFIGDGAMGLNPSSNAIRVAVIAWPWGKYLGEELVSEASGENVFLVRNGVLRTPPLHTVLDGITRATVCELAQHRGISVEERSITRDDLYVADEVFLTGTAAEVTPIREVDRRMIGNGRRGPMTKLLQEAYFDVVGGREPEFQRYLTYV
jgi:branched-chain amino acid aminotransferase